MADQDDLIVKIKSDIRALQAGLRQAAKEADHAGRQIETNLGGRLRKVDEIARNTAISATAALLDIGRAAIRAGSAFAEIFTGALEAADGLAKLSDKTGVSIEELQRLQYAANQAGLSEDALAGGLEKLTRKLGEARSGSADAARDFRALHVELKDGAGQARTTEQVFLDVVRRLEAIEDPAKRAAAATLIFGKAGTEIAVIASQGAGAVDRMRGELDQLGGVLGADLVRAGDSAGDALDRLRKVISAGLNKAVLQIAPQLERFINELLKDPQAIQARIDQFVEAATAIGKVGAAAGAWLGNVVKFAEALGEAVGAMVHGSDIPFEEELTGISEKIALLQLDLQNLDETHPDFKMVSDQLRDHIQKYTELRALQQQYLQPPEKPAPLPPPPAPPPPPGGAGGDDFRLPPSGKGKEKDPVEEALKAAIKQEEIERYVQDMKDDAAKAEAKRYGERIEAERTYVQSRAEMVAELDAVITDEETQRLKAEQENFTRHLGQLDSMNAEELAILGGYNQAKEELIRQHEDNTFKIREQGLQSGLDMLTKIEDAKLRKEVDSAAKGLAVAATFSKKAFEANKLLSMANAVVKGIEAVQSSYAYGASIGGPPLGAAFAAVAAAVAAANVRAIQATKFGGGGAASSVPGAANPNNVTPAGGGGDGGRAAPQINLTLIGSGYSQDQVRELIVQINEALADGAQLRGR